MSLSKQLENIEALDPEGRPVQLGEFWQERPVVLNHALQPNARVAEGRAPPDRISQAAGVSAVLLGRQHLFRQQLQ